MKTILAIRKKGSQTRKGSALPAADALQNVVQNLVKLIGGGGRADVCLFRQLTSKLFLLHPDLISLIPAASGLPPNRIRVDNLLI